MHSGPSTLRASVEVMAYIPPPFLGVEQTDQSRTCASFLSARKASAMDAVKNWSKPAPRP